MIAVDAHAGGTDAESASALPPGPIDRIRGRVSHPETTRSTRDHCSAFVNGRYVRDADLRSAVIDAYGDQLAGDRYPFVVLFVAAPAETTDVNVHPRKLEVRFDDGAGARQQIRSAVENALLDDGLVRSGAPRGRSAPDETTLDPGGGAPTESEDRSESSSDDAQAGAASNGDSERPAKSTGPGAADTSAVEAGTEQPDSAAGASDETDTAAGTASEPASVDASTNRGGPGAEGGPSGGRFDATAQAHLGDGKDETASADERAAFDRLPSLRVLGQVDDTYVVGEADDGLVLIDQHAADERITYERLRNAVAGGASQSLVDPVDVELTAGEAALLEAATDPLERIGFGVERADDRTVRVTAVPAVLGATVDPGIIRSVIGAFATGRDPDAPVTGAADDLLADLACYPSITANTALSDGSIVDLLDRLDACENPYACPHGRPVVVRIDDREIEDRFERDYPGHDGGQ